jgi:hypothetical protein
MSCYQPTGGNQPPRRAAPRPAAEPVTAQRRAQQHWRHHDRRVEDRPRPDPCRACIAVGRAMAGHCRELDPTRPVTAGVNLMLNGLATVGIGAFKAEEPGGATGAARPGRGRARGGKRDDREMPAVGSAFFNLLYSRIGPILNHVGGLRRVDRATSGIFQVLDVAGYNYGAGTYRVTGRRHPGRVVVGTETLPGNIVRNWQQVEELPYVIGDFMWTGWDYLGEAGAAAWSYGPDRKPNLKRYPYLLAAAGAVDITGLPGAMAFHAQAAWGQRDEPAIVVRPLDRVGQSVLKSPWRTTDGIPSWSWTGYEGTETEVVVFSAADSLELLLNGHSLGTRPAGQGDGEDLAFVEVELADAAGTVVPLSGVALQAQVDGAGTLAGFGSANPKPLDSYTNGLHSTYYGRALAVVRAGYPSWGRHADRRLGRFRGAKGHHGRPRRHLGWVPVKSVTPGGDETNVPRAEDLATQALAATRMLTVPEVANRTARHNGGQAGHQPAREAAKPGASSGKPETNDRHRKQAINGAAKRAPPPFCTARSGAASRRRGGPRDGPPCGAAPARSSGRSPRPARVPAAQRRSRARAGAAGSGRSASAQSPPTAWPT